MKKNNTLKFIFAFVLSIIFVGNVNARSVTLEEIADAFNANPAVDEYKVLVQWKEISAVARNTENILHISYTDMNDHISGISYKLNGNILSFDHLVGDEQITASLLADSIGKLQGYEYGDVIENFNTYDEGVRYYSVENEGFEMHSNDSYFSTKMDITKKIPMLYYITDDELDILKTIVDSKEPGNQSGETDHFHYNFIINPSKNEIDITETGGLTNNAYMSILSVLKVMYGDKVVEYFKENYTKIDPDFSVDFGGFSINIVDNNIKITIDNEYIADVVTRTEYIGEIVDHGKKTISLDLSNGKTYKIDSDASVSDSDVAFFIKYVLEPIAIGVEAPDNTIYFNIVDGKIVVGNKDNNLFKLVINDDFSIIISSTNNDVDKTSVSAINDNAIAMEYDLTSEREHFRYGKYTVTTNITYGKDAVNPDTSDNININVMVLVISIIGIMAITVDSNKKSVN